MKTEISTHSQFDDKRYWEFVRDSKIAHGTFDAWSWERAGHTLVGALAYIGCLVFVVMAALRVFE